MVANGLKVNTRQTHEAYSFSACLARAHCVTEGSAISATASERGRLYTLPL